MIQKIIWTLSVLFFVTVVIYTQNHKSGTVVENTEIEKIIPVNVKHLKCLATGIYYESKGEPTIGQIAVARVIMNRVLHGFADDPCDVVYQTTTRTNSEGIQVKLCQFSWVCDGKTTPPDTNPSFQQAKIIAKQILSEDKWSDLIPNNTLFFHSVNVDPNWPYKKFAVIGNHIFYMQGSEKNTQVSTLDK